MSPGWLDSEHCGLLDSSHMLRSPFVSQFQPNNSIPAWTNVTETGNGLRNLPNSDEFTWSKLKSNLKAQSWKHLHHQQRLQKSHALSLSLDTPAVYFISQTKGRKHDLLKDDDETSPQKQHTVAPQMVCGWCSQQHPKHHLPIHARHQRIAVHGYDKEMTRLSCRLTVLKEVILTFSCHKFHHRPFVHLSVVCWLPVYL